MTTSSSVAARRHAAALVVALAAVAAARRFVPVGAPGALPAVPTEVTISDDDLRRASRSWDHAMDDYAGLLDAAVAPE